MNCGGAADDDCRLIQGDCKDVLRTLDAGGIDAVVTDPPYGIGHRRGSSSRQGIARTWKPASRPIAGDGQPFEPAPWLGFPRVAFTGAQHFYDRLPPGGALHCWDKRGNYKPLDQADADVIWCSAPAKSRVLHLAWRGLCRHAEHNQRYEHPTQKPVALMEWIIGLLGLLPGATVLDPYMGSGTTGIAAANLGCRFVGIECDAAYFGVAARRLAAARAAAAATARCAPAPATP